MSGTFNPQSIGPLALASQSASVSSAGSGSGVKSLLNTSSRKLIAGTAVVVGAYLIWLAYYKKNKKNGGYLKSSSTSSAPGGVSASEYLTAPPAYFKQQEQQQQQQVQQQRLDGKSKQLSESRKLTAEEQDNLLQLNNPDSAGTWTNLSDVWEHMAPSTTTTTTAAAATSSCSASACPHPVHVTPIVRITSEPQFWSLLNHHPALMVGFMSDNCGHCVRMKPAWLEASQQSKIPFVEISGMECQGLLARYNPSGRVPTIVKVKSNKTHHFFDGSRTKEELLKFAHMEY